jgi:predicted transcriptional regulator
MKYVSCFIFRDIGDVIMESQMANPRRPTTKDQRKGSWVFLTNHAHVLLCVARDPQARTRDIAEQVGITERATQRILADLVAEGYVARAKVGRRNSYTINRRGRLRHPLFRNLTIGPLLEVLNTVT